MLDGLERTDQMKRFDPRMLGAGGVLALAFLAGVAIAPNLDLTAAAQGIGNAAGEMLGQADQNGPHGDLYAAAATYIGISEADLRTALQSGKSLADVAVEHGKTRDGLIQALTQVDQARIAQVVDQKGLPAVKPGPGRGFDKGVLGDSFAAAATYLGTTEADLMTKLRAGQSLAQIGNATTGKSRDGLVQALVADANTKIDQAQANGKITADQATQLKSNLQTRLGELVDNTSPRGFPRGFGPGPRR